MQGRLQGLGVEIMTSQQIAHEGVEVVLLSAGQYPGLAARTLARQFGVTLEKSEALLAKGHGTIAAFASDREARAAQPLLMALGLQIAIGSPDTGIEAALYDLYARPVTPEAAADLKVALEGMGEPIGRAMPGPSGLVIRGLNQARLDDLRRPLDEIDGLEVTVSARREAHYDLFRRQDGSGRISAALLRHLSMIGCRADRATAALAVDLDQRCLAHVLARFPDCGLVGVNQAFQRYDLSLTGTGRLTRHEMRDFLVTRGVYGPDLVDALAAGEPLRIERGLARRATRQFLADYATIGIPARAELILA